MDIDNGSGNDYNTSCRPGFYFLLTFLLDGFDGNTIGDADIANDNGSGNAYNYT